MLGMFGEKEENVGVQVIQLFLRSVSFPVCGGRHYYHSIIIIGGCEDGDVR
jgi:hypothetical protein